MMNTIILLLIFIHWYSFRLVKSSSSFFDIDENILQTPYYVNENFSIGATFKLPSAHKCINSQCFTNLKLTIRNDHQLLMNLWCDSPAGLLTKKYTNTEELSCALNGIDATTRSYRLSAVAQVHTAGSFIPIFSAIFPNDPAANQEWIGKEITILNSPNDEQQLMKLRTVQRNKRQNMNIDGTNIQSVGIQAGNVNDNNTGQIQTMLVNDGTNVNQPVQLNTYTGILNPGYTADLTCNGASSCPGYPKTDEQGRGLCCFQLPQASNGITALSSVIYQNGAQNLKDFQVNVGIGQSFNAANDLSVFVGQVIATVQCNVILFADASPSNTAQFRITWTYHSNSGDNNSPSPSIPTVADGTLAVNVLRVTSSSAFVQQFAQYNEWFVCPPSQNGQVSLLQSMALLSGNNIDYFRCIYVNKQGIPLKDPTTGQLLVFTSTKNYATDDPTITALPVVHTDCVAIQFFPTTRASIDLSSILLSITTAFQTVPPTDMSSVTPQVSDLQGTFQIEIDVTINISPNNVNSNDQTFSSSAVGNPSQTISVLCTRYQSDVPMSFYDTSVGKYTGTFDISSQNSQPVILDSITAVGSSQLQNPITMLLVDSQGNTLSPSYSLTSGTIFQDAPNTVLSKIIFQAIALQDAPMDSTLDTDIVVCPPDTADSAPLPSPAPVSPAILPSQTYNQVPNGGGPSPVTNIAPISQNSAPVQSFQPPPNVTPDPSLNCQERTSSSFGTYPPDLSALTIPTKKPPTMLRIQPAVASETYATPPTPSQSLPAQMLSDPTCFNQISFSNNPFVYDIIISTSDYTNDIDCLSSTSGCSINFTNTKQPKITLLFTAPACLSYLRIPSPSNVQQFSYSVYDENGNQIQLPGVTNNQGTLLSSSGDNPQLQLNQYSCGYGIIVQLLMTNDNGPPIRVTIDAGGCFGKSSVGSTAMTPVLPPAASVPSPSSQQLSPSLLAPSYVQPSVFGPSPGFVPPSAISLTPSPPSALPLPPSPPVVQVSLSWNQAVPAPIMMPSQQQPSSPLSTSPSVTPSVPLYCANTYELTTLSFGSQCLSGVATNDPSVIPDYTINPGNQGASFESDLPITIIYQFNCTIYIKYICITGVSANVNKFSYRLLASNHQNVGQGIVNRLTSDQCTPRPLPTAVLANQVVITIEETTDGQPPTNITIDMQGCFSASPSPAFSSQTQYVQSPLPPSLSPPLPSSAPVARPPVPSQTILTSPSVKSLPSPALQPSSTAILPSPYVLVQTVIASPILSSAPAPVFSPPAALNPSPVFYSPSPSQVPPSVLLLASPAVQRPLAPLPSQNIPTSPVYAPLPPPVPPSFQTSLSSPILSPPLPFYATFSLVISYSSPQIPSQSPSMPPQQYSSQIMNQPPLYQAPLPSSPVVQTPPPFVAVTPPIPAQPLVSLQAPPIPVPIRAILPAQQTPSTPLGQNTTTPGPPTSSNICPQISLTSHPSIELVVFSDGTNVTSDLNPDGNGCNLLSTGTTMTVLLRDGAPATFSSVGVSSSNVNQIDVALFDEISNRPLIQSSQGTIRSSLTLNPTVQNLPVNPAATLAITFVNTIDGQPPRNVRLLVYACFPTVTEILSSPASINPSQPQYPSIGPTNVCIDLSQPAQVTSVANTILPREYYSSNQCVCICQSGIILPTSSGVIQYDPSSRTTTEKSFDQHRRKRQNSFVKSTN